MLRGIPDFIMSNEGVTLGDPLYYQSICNRYSATHTISSQLYTQLWYAGDVSAGALLTDVHEWFLYL